MSTEYGFKCKNCDKAVIVDNMRSYGIPALNKILQKEVLAAIEVVNSVPDLFVSSRDYNLDEALEFVILHSKVGHVLVVVDEYGREQDQCSKDWTCSCGTERHCELKSGHDGECASGGARWSSS